MIAAGIAPVIPGAAGKGLKRLTYRGVSGRDVFDSLTDQARLPVSEIFDAGTPFLGDNPVKLDSGVYLSRQPVQDTDVVALFRITDGDILGTHAGGPHANFELVRRVVRPDGRVSYETIRGGNKHIYFSDP